MSWTVGRSFGWPEWAPCPPPGSSWLAGGSTRGPASVGCLGVPTSRRGPRRRAPREQLRAGPDLDRAGRASCDRRGRPRRPRAPEANFVEYDATTAVNTDPRLVAATVEAMRQLGARHVVVAEGPGHRRDTRYVIEPSGLGDALRSVHVPFVDLNVDQARVLRLKSRYTPLSRLALPAAILDADVVVSMPKMKMHHWAGVTLSLKNCFGCVPGRIYGWPKNALHWAGIEGAILDVAAAVRPHLAIVDGIVAMEGDGPITGDPVRVGALVFGDDPWRPTSRPPTSWGWTRGEVAYLAEAGRFLGQAGPDRDRSGRGPVDACEASGSGARIRSVPWRRDATSGRPQASRSVPEHARTHGARPPMTKASRDLGWLGAICAGFGGATGSHRMRGGCVCRSDPMCSSTSGGPARPRHEGCRSWGSEGEPPAVLLTLAGALHMPPTAVLAGLLIALAVAVVPLCASLARRAGGGSAWLASAVLAGAFARFLVWGYLAESLILRGVPRGPGAPRCTRRSALDRRLRVVARCRRTTPPAVPHAGRHGLVPRGRRGPVAGSTTSA